MATRSRSEPVEMLYRPLPDGSFIRDVFPPDVKGLLRQRAAAPIKPKKPQAPCDVGLFSDDADQLDLVEMFQEPAEDD
jgi:hypothetical protein